MKEKHEKNWVNAFDKKQFPPDMEQWRLLKARMEAEGLIKKPSSEPSTPRTSKKWIGLTVVVLLSAMISFAYFQKEQKALISKIENIEKQNEFFRTELEKSAIKFAPEVSTASANLPQEAAIPGNSYVRTLFLPIRTSESFTKRISRNVKAQPIKDIAPGISYRKLSIEDIEASSFKHTLTKDNRKKSIQKSISKSHSDLAKTIAANMQAQNAIDAQWDELAQQRDIKDDNEVPLVMGVKGGLFSGNMQNGVTGSFNVGTELASNVILEADMGIINAMGSEGGILSSQLSKTTPSFNANTPLTYDAIRTGSVIHEGEQNIGYLYATINPTAGYRFSDRVALKMGVDVQNNLSKDDRITYVKVDEYYYQLAKYDFGLTPKISYKLNSKIEGEFIYRNGINTSVYGGQFWNRNYFFAQLRYSIR